MINFIVWSPEYSDSSGGIMCLHLLARDLALRGHNVMIYAQNTIEGSLAKTIKTNDYQFSTENTMSIYPEIIVGNPLNTKYVTRWLLNTPGYIGGDGVYEDSDLIYKYQDYFHAPDENKVNGYLRTLNAKLDLYQNKYESRNGECFLVKKGRHKTLNQHSIDSVNIDSWVGDEYLVNLFNQKEKFISYDPITFHSVQAALCGCISVIIPEEGISKEEYHKRSPLFKYGIAYGFEDIQYAKETIHLVRDYIKECEDECQFLIDNYINDCYSHMSLIKN